MATKDGPSISGEALEILNCFVAGLDEVILETAEDIARRSATPGQPIMVEVPHVKAAADLVVRLILESDEFSREIKEAVKQMSDSIASKNSTSR